MTYAGNVVGGCGKATVHPGGRSTDYPGNIVSIFSSRAFPIVALPCDTYRNVSRRSSMEFSLAGAGNNRRGTPLSILTTIPFDSLGHDRKKRKSPSSVPDPVVPAPMSGSSSFIGKLMEIFREFVEKGGRAKRAVASPGKRKGRHGCRPPSCSAIFKDRYPGFSSRIN